MFKPTLTAALIAGVCAGCGSAAADTHATASQRAPMTTKLKPGHYTFHLGGRVRAGDKIACITRSGSPAGGGYVPKSGQGVAASTGFSVSVSGAGIVKITCPAHPSPL